MVAPVSAEETTETTLPAAWYTSTGEGDSDGLTLTDYSLSNISIAVTLDVNALKACSGSFFASAGITQLVSVSGTWAGTNNAQARNSGVEGFCLNGSSTGKYTNFWGAWSAGSTSANNYKITGLSDVMFFTDNGVATGSSVSSATVIAAWDQITALSYVFVKDSAENTADINYGYFSIATRDGQILQYSGNVAAFKFTGDAYLDSLSAITINSDLVKNYTVYDSALSAADATAVGKSLVPEPATATLSLLALAGLAVRRRRR